MQAQGLRRSQSMRDLSGGQERSWVTPAAFCRDRKSVSQLVQQYQSCQDLRSSEKTKDKVQAPDGFLAGRRRRSESRERFDPQGPQSSFGLSRSRSVDFLPQGAASGTRYLRALFESKASPQSGLASGPRLDSPAAPGAKAGKGRLPQGAGRTEGGQAVGGLRESCVTPSRRSHDNKNSPSPTKGGDSATQARDRIPTSSSVRDRSALYLSRAAAVDSTRGSAQPQEVIGTPGTRVKDSKMADAARKITVSRSSHDEEDLPLPPPPPVPPRPLDYEGPSALSGLPVPPPKETFSTFYQQRQKSELKRLFKHIHPDLRSSLDIAVDDDILQAVQSESAKAGDAAYQGEVQSMRWIFENWTLDNIGDPHETKKLLDEEDFTGGNVRSTSSVFECGGGGGEQRGSGASPQRQSSVRGDVRTSTWLFETQPLDSISKTKTEDGELVEAVLKEPIQPGDVSGTRLLFETKPLSDLGRCNSIEDHDFLKLRSELQEQKGDVQKTVKLFQAEPCCAIRDKSGNIHKIKSICREEIKSGATSTARWLFETQPLDLINKETDSVKIIRGISLEEGRGGGVDRKRWMFETQSFDTIREAEAFRGAEAATDSTVEAGVTDKRQLFEMQPLDSLKGDSEGKTLEKDEIIGGDVKTSLWLFETQPMETLSDSYEVGCLKKIALSADEQGAVKDRKRLFETCDTAKSAAFREQEIERGDVKGFKHLFETIPLSKIAHSDDEEVRRKETDASAGDVKDGKAPFETTPLYAIEDSSGNFHKITTVSREECIRGRVQNYKWMFETKPLLAEGKGNVEVIKGITRQEDTAGDVKTAKWMFETQTIDGIHSKFNQTEQKPAADEEPRKGDVRTCKWLFETKPMDVLYDKSEKADDKEAVDSTDVKSITWLFESQPLDSIKEGEEYNLELCGTIRDSVKSELGVRTVKRLFETETLDSIRKDMHSERDVRCVSRVNFQSGDVSRVKELFESQSLDEIGGESVTVLDGRSEDHIQKGSVHKFTWLFENCPMNKIHEENSEASERRVGEEVSVKSGDVRDKKFIFETSSLDKIHDRPLERKTVGVERPVTEVDVKSSSMMFESLPRYAIRDKEGQFHEVKTVKKEEVMSGDVRGARWMFETKPLDAIKAENEVYVIRAVTQEDVKKGDVNSARWKFETQPLDSLTVREEPSVKVAEDFGNANVRLNKQLFESERSSGKFVRMVSVTDVQQGDVRTSTWLFENQPIDSLKGEPQEQVQVKTVHREDSQKGEVKRCTWLFESQPLDKINEPDEAPGRGAEREIPKADVKCTTWLFETTPLDKITASGAADSLSYLHEMSFVHSGGIIIEAQESGKVSMAKYLRESDAGIQIQKEDVVSGNVRNIMLQLLLKPTNSRVALLREVEKGKVNTTVVELPVYQSTASINLESDQRVQNIVRTIDELLVQDKDLKKGILMQETAGGRAEMSVYSLIGHADSKSDGQVIERGDVKSAIGNLLATAGTQRAEASCRVDENEKGNVNLYKSCIEKGDLHYLKSLRTETSEDEVDFDALAKEHVEIVQGDVREAKRSLCQQKDQVERTVSDVLPGDVRNTKKVFSSECPSSVENCIPREEIIPGDVSTAKKQLAVKQSVTVEREEIVAGDIKATMESLERAKQQSMCPEREVVIPGTIYDMDITAKGPETEGSQPQKEVIISGDVKAAKRSLQLAKQQSMHTEREVIVPGKIYNLNASAPDESASAVPQSSSSRGQQIKTYPQVSDEANDQGSYASFDARQRVERSQSAVIVRTRAPESPTPFVSGDYDGLTTEDEAESVVRGDVKAAIRSLRSAATEQKLLDKEDIVRGNVHLALQSLEKSSVNVSKGDFKAAMIYRNSGRTGAERSKAVHKQCVVVSMPPSDTKLSPSISVTCEGRPPITTQNSTPNPVANGNSKSPSPEVIPAPSPPPKTIEKPQDQKPALPPKPQWTKSVVVVEDPKASDAPEVSRLGKDDPKSATAPPGAEGNKRIHVDVIGEDARRSETNQESSDETPHADECLPTSWKPRETDETTSNGPELEMERNVIRKINAAEEIQMCMKRYAEHPDREMNMSLKAALKNFERKDGEVPHKGAPLLSKKVKVINGHFVNRSSEPTPQRRQQSLQQTVKENGEMSEADRSVRVYHTRETDNLSDHKDKVVLREKKVKETEVERRQRLSVHKDEIMKGNVQAAMEIFENLRKRDELKEILSQVREIEGDTGDVDVGSVTTLCEKVPSWMGAARGNAKRGNKDDKKVEAESQDEDLESISSVETAFEDLEKASKEIMNLKEQTLVKLLEIEETIKKALYSVSNLKSEADIAGLSGLFDESLKSEQPANNIRKISIVSSKAKSGQNKETANVDRRTGPESSPSRQEARKQEPKPLVRQSSSQSSPSFISIHSAARKPTTSASKPGESQTAADADPRRDGAAAESSKDADAPAQRKVSVLEVKTLPEQPAGIIGTKTVSETYEESDGFGNVFVSSVTSTVVTKQSDGKASALFEAAGSPARYEVVTSPLLRRPARPFEDKVLSGAPEKGKVFVTFSPPMEKQ